MKKALVLAGGGTRGSYQNGAMFALRKLQQDDWKIVTGTSIGALNAIFVVNRDYEGMNRMWSNIQKEDIISGAIPDNLDLTTFVKEKNNVTSFVKNYIKDKGADITPLIHKVEDNFHEETFMKSDIEFGCVVVQWPSKKPVYITKENMNGHGVDWLVASASAFPAFPIHYIDEVGYADGGYFDNLPIDFALQLGAEEIIAIDLNDEPQHPNFMNRPNIHYIFPKVKTGSFLNFDQAMCSRLERLGYLDTLKEFKYYDGYCYTFEKTELPEWFFDYYLDILKLETKIKLATDINEKFRSSQVITDHILETQYKKVLSYKDMFFGLLDSLLDTINGDVTHVYTYEEVRDLLLDAYAKPFQEDFSILPENRNPKELLAYKRTLDTKGVIEKLIHTTIYPEHEFFSENLYLTMYPYEKALANFMVCMGKEKGIL